MWSLWHAKMSVQRLLGYDSCSSALIVYWTGCANKNSPLEKKCCNSATVVRIWAKCSDFVHEYSRNLFCKFYWNGRDGSTEWWIKSIIIVTVSEVAIVTRGSTTARQRDTDDSRRRRVHVRTSTQLRTVVVRRTVVHLFAMQSPVTHPSSNRARCRATMLISNRCNCGLLLRLPCLCIVCYFITVVMFSL